SLDEAQRAKLDLICQKLNLQQNERLLDIGCGWGGLLLHAGRHYGAQGLGLTLSENQRDEAKRRLARLTVPMEVLRSDDRELELEGAFDKVASVGMMEHVGRAQLDRYFSKVYYLLRPGGLFLNHAIADIAVDIKTVAWAARWRRGFIQTYIFPDSDLVPI